MLLDTGPAPIRGVWAAAFDAAERAGEAAIYGGSRPIDLVGALEFGEQDLVQAG
jgi:hypothetical protein